MSSAPAQQSLSFHGIELALVRIIAERAGQVTTSQDAAGIKMQFDTGHHPITPMIYRMLQPFQWWQFCTGTRINLYMATIHMWQGVSLTALLRRIQKTAAREVTSITAAFKSSGVFIPFQGRREISHSRSSTIINEPVFMVAIMSRSGHSREPQRKEIWQLWTERCITTMSGLKRSWRWLMQLRGHY